MNTSKKQWNKDSIAMCIQRGLQRVNFLEEAERMLEEHSEDFDNLEKLPKTDQHYEEWVEVVGQVAQNYFKREPYKNQWYKEQQGKQKEMIAQLKETRLQLQDDGQPHWFNEEQERLRQKLNYISKTMRQHKRKVNHTFQKMTVEDLWEAHTQQDPAKVCQCCR